MTTVWKYQIPIQRRCEIVMPLGAKVLSIQLQPVREGGWTENVWKEADYQRPFIWALVNSIARPRVRVFHFIFTGDPVDVPREALEYVGTVQFTETEMGTIVWHLFEIPSLEHAPPLAAPNQDTQSKEQS